MVKITLHQGDCLVKLKELPDNSVDSIVTDPPYGWSFMGSKWDYDVPKVEVWKECMRVLKPGGHILVACGTRTQHRMAVNIEDAGFEIRDVVAWIYGSGFPKSLNVGKKVDEIQGNERESVGTRTRVYGYDKDYDNSFDASMFDVGDDNTITKGSSEWEGWGTSLKPAMELWTLARKPISERNIAENALKHGVGGINVDSCRIGTETISVHDAPKGTFAGGEEGRGSDTETYREHEGRYPANVILECICETEEHTDPNCPCYILDQQSGESTSSGGRIGVKDPNMFGYGGKFVKGNPGFGDFGGASRFFYCPKASRDERNKGLANANIPEKSIRDAEGDKENWDLSEGKVRARMVTQPQKNYHPTVKPVTLMTYLCRLITPPKGVVLDLFMGSGTTGVAAKIEGFNFIGIELMPEYLAIAKARIDAVQTQTKLGDFP